MALPRRLWTIAAFLIIGSTVMPALAVSAEAPNLIVNGSFDDGYSSGMRMIATVDAPNTTRIPGWAISVGSVDILGDAFWEPAPGSIVSLDMSGLTAGTIEQSFATTPGANYNVGFALAGNTDRQEIKRLLVAAAGQQQVFSFDSTGHSRAAMGWEYRQFSFTADGDTTTLSFASLNGSPWGPALDDVVVTLADVVVTLADEPGGDGPGLSIDCDKGSTEEKKDYTKEKKDYTKEKKGNTKEKKGNTKVDRRRDTRRNGDTCYDGIDIQRAKIRCGEDGKVHIRIGGHVENLDPSADLILEIGSGPAGTFGPFGPFMIAAGTRGPLEVDGGRVKVGLPKDGTGSFHINVDVNGLNDCGGDETEAELALSLNDAADTITVERNTDSKFHSGGSAM